MKAPKILVTTAIDYCNAPIHIGHGYEKILADAVARHHRLQRGKNNVFFVTGTDEHGTTNEKAAREKGVDTKTHVDQVSKADREEYDSLNISYDRFIRTTDADHTQIAADFFKRSYENGYMYKDMYTGLYCEGCDAYKTLSELNENGQCVYHPTREIQQFEEENYFFRWSAFTDFLRDILTNNVLVILPETKRAEMLAFIEQGIQDIPVSRPKYKLPWGITTPIDDSQVIYVWFDALINYFTVGTQNNFWDETTEIVHFIGKDIARWHTLLWPAMLKSAGYRLPDTVYVHGFINLNGQKISKSLGNVIAPHELVEKYGSDAVRYYFLKHGPITEDVNISFDHFEEVYTADLANGLGNLVARVAKLLEKAGYTISEDTKPTYELSSELQNAWNRYRVDIAIQLVWERIRALDKYLDDTKPWEFFKEDPLSNHDNVWQHLLTEIRTIAVLVEPFIPKTAQKIQQQFSKTPLRSSDGLFPRLP